MRRARPCSRPDLAPRGERGAAFLVALGALALVAALAAAALSLAAGPATRAAAAVAEAEARRAAEAAVHRLLAATATETLRRALPLGGEVVSTAFDEGFAEARLDLAAQDAGGLIDLNHADEAALARLLTHAGAAEAAEIAAFWARGREAAGGRGGFATPEAALTVLPEALRAAARPALAHATVWSGRAAVDPETATAPALAAAADLTLGAAQAHVARRALEGRGAPPPEAPAGAYAASEARTIRFSVRTETAAGGRAAVEVTARFGGSPRRPVEILAWR